MLSFRPRRWLVHIALAFGAGVYLGGGLRPGALGLLTAALCCLCWFWLNRQGKSPYLAVLALAAMLGMLRCGVAAHPTLPSEGTYTVTAVVEGDARVRESDGRVAVYLADAHLEGTEKVTRAYWTYWPKDENIPLPMDGQRVQFTGRVYHPSGQVNPHGFDFRMYLLQKGVPLGVTGCGGLTVSSERRASPGLWLRSLRRAIRERLNDLLGDQGPLAAALLLNDREDLPEDVAEDFRISGTAHVLAVSGLHVMILFSCALLLLRRFSPSQRTVLLIGATLIGAYALLVGARAAVLRAGVLAAYLQMGRMFRRRGDPLTALAAAFTSILLLRPLELFSAGFQMSFGAVLAMIVVGDRIACFTRRIENTRLRRVATAYAGTLCGAIGAAFAVGWYYHSLSLMGLLISPLAVALVTLLLPALIGLLLLSVPLLPAARLLGRAVSLLCALLSEIARRSAEISWASFPIRRLPFYVLLALAMCLLLCSRYVLLKWKSRILLGLGALAASVALMLACRNRDARYIQFSLGDADAAVIEDGRATVVIDTGDRGSELAEYLRSEGRSIEALILTHLHSDHVLGLEDLLRAGISIGALYVPDGAELLAVSDTCRQALEHAEAAGVPIRTLCAGDRLDTPRVNIETVWPEHGGVSPGADANDFALGLLIDLDGVTMLHASDISGTYEMYAARPAQVLRAAHHGSASSTGAAFLAAVRPDIVLISARNPSEATLSRLAEAGAMVYDTNERGAITLTARQGEAIIQTRRQHGTPNIF